MRSADRPAGDLTARARIIDAALAQFAERGGRATLRSIAEAAGVSVGLVQHHFGTKDGLRAACDERVLAYTRAKIDIDGRSRDPSGTGAVPDEGWADPELTGWLYDTATPLMPYIARAVLDDDERAAMLFDEITDLTAGWLTARWPDRFAPGTDATGDAAAAMVAMSMGTAVLQHQLGRVMGGHDRPHLTPRIGLAALAVFRAMGDYLASPVGAQITEALEAYALRHDPEPASAAGPDPDDTPDRRPRP